jgi:hypothetical protein
LKKATRILDSISGYLFLTGFLSTKLKNIPVALVSSIFNVISLFAYLIGYVVWYVSALLYPEHPRRRDSWYGFAQFKDQYQIAALLGTIATISTIIGLIFPPLIIPTAWLYTISNFVWSASEYHKQQNTPPGNESYSTAKQGIYIRYTLLVTASSIVAALGITVAILCPPAAFIVIPATTIIGILLTVASLAYWGKAAFGHYPPDRVDHSYQQLSKQLSFPLAHSPKQEIEPIPEQTIKNQQTVSPPPTPEIDRDVYTLHT